jgi:hypothetical protein
VVVEVLTSQDDWDGEKSIQSQQLLLFTDLFVEFQKFIWISFEN